MIGPDGYDTSDPRSGYTYNGSSFVRKGQAGANDTVMGSGGGGGEGGTITSRSLAQQPGQLVANPAGGYYYKPYTPVSRVTGYSYAPGSGPGSSVVTPQVETSWNTPNGLPPAESSYYGEGASPIAGSLASLFGASGSRGGVVSGAPGVPGASSTQPFVGSTAQQGEAYGAQTGEDVAANALGLQEKGQQFASDLGNTNADLALARLKGFLGPGGAGAGFLNMPAVSGGSALTPDEEAAQAAAFARAKDTAGSLARSSIDSLNALFASRGLNVAGGENPLLTAAQAQVLGQTGNQLGEVNREQLIQELNRAAQVGNTEFQGAITERGQNLGALQSLMSMLTARPLY